jgi:hypothetical protein
MKTEVYSWRVSAELKTTLEREARRRKTRVSTLLDLAVRELLENGGNDPADEEEQRRLQSTALKCVGAFAGGDPDRSANVRRDLRQRLRKQRGA